MLIRLIKNSFICITKPGEICSEMSIEFYRTKDVITFLFLIGVLCGIGEIVLNFELFCSNVSILSYILWGVTRIFFLWSFTSLTLYGIGKILHKRLKIEKIENIIVHVYTLLIVSYAIAAVLGAFNLPVLLSRLLVDLWIILIFTILVKKLYLLDYKKSLIVGTLSLFIPLTFFSILRIIADNIVSYLIFFSTNFCTGTFAPTVFSGILSFVLLLLFFVRKYVVKKEENEPPDLLT